MNHDTRDFYESKQDQEFTTTGSLSAISNFTNAVYGGPVHRVPSLPSSGRNHAVYSMDALVRHL
jgi:hypothetical protein